MALLEALAEKEPVSQIIIVPSRIPPRMVRITAEVAVAEMETAVLQNLVQTDMYIFHGRVALPLQPQPEMRHSHSAPAPFPVSSQAEQTFNGMQRQAADLHYPGIQF